jgi:hypothetical protein
VALKVQATGKGRTMKCVVTIGDELDVYIDNRKVEFVIEAVTTVQTTDTTEVRRLIRALSIWADWKDLNEE